jgi:hypothetical protein
MCFSAGIAVMPQINMFNDDNKVKFHKYNITINISVNYESCSSENNR